MKNLDYDLNLPVHIARRDVFFEKAVESYREPGGESTLNNDIKRVEVVAFMVRSATWHASLISRRNDPDELDDACLVLLNMMYHHIKAVRFLMESELLLRKRMDRIKEAIGKTAATPDKVLSEMVGRRSAIENEIRDIMELAGGVFRKRKRNALQQMDKDDKSRHSKAVRGLKKYLKEKMASPETIPYQISCAIHEMMCE